MSEGESSSGWVRPAAIIAASVATSLTASSGVQYLREPPPTNGNGYALLRQEVAALRTELTALERHIEQLSGERERRFQALEQRVDQLYRRIP
jgi:hypothetical protein